MSESGKTTLGTAALVVGIIAIAISYIPIINISAFILGVLAIVFGLITLNKSGKSAEIISAVVLGIAAILITLITQITAINLIVKPLGIINDIMTNDSQPTISEEDIAQMLKDNNVEVSFGEFSVQKNTYYAKTSLPVTVKNVGNKYCSFTIKIEAVDKKGHQIATDSIHIDTLPAGQTITEKIFENVGSTKLPDFENARFRVIEVSKF